MSTEASVLDRARLDIEARITKLTPMVEEHIQLVAAHAALVGSADAPAPSTQVRAPQATEANEGGGKSNGAAPRRRARRARKVAAPGERREQLLAGVRATPGATVASIAGAVGAKPAHLYRVANALISSGELERGGDGGLSLAAPRAVEPSGPRAATTPEEVQGEHRPTAAG